MTARDFRQGRKQAELTQKEAAHKLGVSQTYLSLLEHGDREPSEKLARKAATFYRLPAALPLTVDLAPNHVPDVAPQTLAEELATLGYPGLSYLRSHRRRNPAEVVFSTLAKKDLEARLVEAVPWVVLQYTNLDWNWLVSAVKQYNLQNRLGFVTVLAARVAERKTDLSKVGVLKEQEETLEQARLAKEDTLCHESLSRAEREWLRQERSEDARHWNLLTDLRPEHVKYAA